MLFRIGSIVISPNAVFFLLAAAFFLVLARRHITNTRTQLVIVVAAIAGAWGQAVILSAEPAIRFATFGGCWGALLAGAVMARYDNQSPLDYTDGLVPAILGALMVGRLGCLFSGCCRGLPGTPFSLWPVYDLAAAGLVWCAAARWNKKGVPTCLFLIGYGALRFGLEWLRSGVWTSGHTAAAVQVAAGVAVCIIVIKAQRTQS